MGLKVELEIENIKTIGLEHGGIFYEIYDYQLKASKIAIQQNNLLLVHIEHRAVINMVLKLLRNKKFKAPIYLNNNIREKADITIKGKHTKEGYVSLTFYIEILK